VASAVQTHVEISSAYYHSVHTVPYSSIVLVH